MGASPIDTGKMTIPEAFEIVINLCERGFKPCTREEVNALTIVRAYYLIKVKGCYDA